MNINPKRAASCHPKELNHARGLCQRCYWQDHHNRKKTDQSYREKRAEAQRGQSPARRRAIYQKWADKAKYGLGPEDVAALLEKQNHRCAVCSKPFAAGLRGFAVDHDHNTGRVRGLLHTRCNSLLGMAGDDERTLLRAIQYLRVGKTTLQEWDVVPA